MRTLVPGLLSFALLALPATVQAQQQQPAQKQQAPAQSQQAPAQSVDLASARILDETGKEVGRAAFRQTEAQGVWITLSVFDVTPGQHALHIHETGRCEGDFKSAGDHFNPGDRKHGAMAEGGPHAGDLPNIHVPDSGRLTIELFAREVSLRPGPATLFDSDGSSIVIHAGVDDYRSQPSGDAGGRVACGVIVPRAGETAGR